MVEQEHSKSSAVFPESLISRKPSQAISSNDWFMNDATSLMKSDELCSSDLLNIELLYGTAPSTDGTLCLPLSHGIVKDQNDMLYHETTPNDIFSTPDSFPCDLYYSDKCTTYARDFWNPMSENTSSVTDSLFEANSPLSFWGCCPLDLEEPLKMDEVFLVDKDDLVQSPTLAELNANDESLFDSFDNFDILLPTEHKSSKSPLLETGLNSNSAYKVTEASHVKISETSTDKAHLVLPVESSEKDDSFLGSDVRCEFNPKENKMDALLSDSQSKSEENDTVNSKIMAQHARKIHSLVAEKETENASQLSIPPENEIFDSEDEDSEMDCDYSSDVDEDSEEEAKVHSTKQGSAKNLLLQKKKSRYFWQYNIQSKGPKAPKMKINEKSAATEDLSDPVFTSSCRKGIKHSGKARRGDGNDLTPNPQKLYNIGLELEKLTSVIEGLIPANELPENARSKSRKEKNKLASRACRLKKKAQHEANKLKLYGLQKEQKHLLGVVSEVKKIIKRNVENVKLGKVQSTVQAKIEALRLKKCYVDVAGCSAEFVNNVLKKVDLGDKTGGLDIEAGDN